MIIMNKNKLKQFDLDLYSEVLDNGLLINIVPKKNVNNIYVTFSTKYGSIHDEFIPIDSTDYYKVPMGVAHFLEHKVFEQEDGIDPFSIFLSNGAIEQELKMLNDKPYWYIYEKSLANSFIEHPIKYPVGGTINTIRKITKEDLYRCYNSFYHPANMFITITGNVEPKEVIRIIKNNQSKKSFDKFKEIKIKKYDEPDKVLKKYEEINFDVILPKVSISYKINILNYDINMLKIYLDIYFAILLDSTSVLDEELREKNLTSSGLYFEKVYTDKHLLYTIDFESDKYQEVIEKVMSIIGKKRITEDELNRKKKSIKSSFIYTSDNIYAINSKINSDIITYGNVILNDFDIVDSLNIDEMNDIIDNLCFENTSIIVLKNNIT